MRRKPRLCAYLSRVWAFHVGLGAVGDPSLKNLLNSSHQEDLWMGASNWEDALFGVFKGLFVELTGKSGASQRPIDTAAVDLQVRPAAVATRHLSHQRMVEIHVEIGWNLSAVLYVEEGQDHIERLYLWWEKEEGKILLQSRRKERSKTKAADSQAP